MSAHSKYLALVDSLNIEQLKLATYNALINEIDNPTESFDEIDKVAFSLIAPPGKTLKELFIKFGNAAMILNNINPTIIIKYDLFILENDSFPYLYYELEFDLKGEIMESYFSKYKY